MSMKYFLYSQEQLDEKNAILERSNKEFVPGVVVDGGVRKNFTVLSTEPEIPRYFDTEIVAYGDDSTMTYTKPTTVKKTKG